MGVKRLPIDMCLVLHCIQNNGYVCQQVVEKLSQSLCVLIHNNSIYLLSMEVFDGWQLEKGMGAKGARQSRSTIAY